MSTALVVALVALALHVFQLRGARYRSSEQRKETLDRFVANFARLKRENERLYRANVTPSGQRESADPERVLP